MSVNYHTTVRQQGHRTAPEGWDEKRWHQDAMQDAGTSHTLPGQLYVVQCEWCEEAFAAPHKREAMEMFRKHEAEMQEKP